MTAKLTKEVMCVEQASSLYRKNPYSCSASDLIDHYESARKMMRIE
jgi:hypothetical protein